MSLSQFEISFDEYVKHKNVEITEKEQANSKPILSQFGIDMKTFDWNNWTYIKKNVFPKVLKFYISDFTQFICNQIANKNEIFLSEIGKRTTNMLYKTSIGGKLNRGLLHIATFKLLREQKQKKKFSEIDAHNALVCCLMFEALQSYCLVMDDVMDQSLTRRGFPCWYKQPNVGLKAINDGPVLESWIFWLIRHRLIVKPNVLLLVEHLIRKTGIQTQFGQMIDLELTENVDDLKKIYTTKRYKTIAEYKAAYYTFYTPYVSALYLCGYDHKKNEKLFYVCKKISIKLGINFQIVDDYLDVYGDYKVMGKIGTDIQDFKCSWLLVKAIHLSNDQQYKLLQENYGKHDEKCIQKIKQLYQDLNLKRVYDEWQQNAYKEMLELVKETVGNTLPHQIFTLIIHRLHNRNK